MNKNGGGLIGRRVQSSNQPRPASISSIVFNEDCYLALINTLLQRGVGG
jgi:hypothetical protein